MNRNLFEEILKERKLSKLKVAMDAGISPGDFYQALSGKIPFYPKWRRLLAECLDLKEDDLFPKDESGEV